MCCGTLLIVYLTLPFTGKDLNFNSDCPSGNLKILCTKLRRGASKTPTVKCCVRQPTCGDREQADVPSKRFQRKTRSPRGSHTEIPIVSSSWHQRCVRNETLFAVYQFQLRGNYLSKLDNIRMYLVIIRMWLGIFRVRLLNNRTMRGAFISTEASAPAPVVLAAGQLRIQLMNY